MKIVYLIQAYKLPDLLVRLVQKLDAPDTTFLIHVDKKTGDETYNRMSRLLAGYANVRFMKRHPTNWGDFSCVADVFRDFEQLISGGCDYDYVLLLSGQDYPIKSNEHIQNILQENFGKSFLNHFPLPSENWPNGGMGRIEYWHFFVRSRIYRLPHPNFFHRPVLRWLNPVLRRIPPKRSLPLQLKPFGGSNYWCLTRECAEYVYHFARENPSVPRFFKHVLFPTETFFHTVIMNSPLKDQVINNNMRYIDWSTHKANPKVLTCQDFEKFMHTDKFFARKFDPTVDAEVLDWIDRAVV